MRPLRLVSLLARPAVRAGDWIFHRLFPRSMRQMSFRFGRRRFCAVCFSKRALHVLIGCLIMYSAAVLYHAHLHFINDEFWELCAFGLHGLGAAPLIKIICDILGFDV